MTSRPDMDTPAIVLTCVAGVLLIGLSAFLFTLTGPEASDFDVAWVQVATPNGAGDTPFAGENQEAFFEVTVTNRLVSNVTVTMPSCSDVRPAEQLQEPVTVTWTLFEGSQQIGTGTTACPANDNVATIPIASHPDIGSTSASSLEAAKDKVWADADNVTATYRLEFTWDRPDGDAPIGLPGPGAPTFAGRMGLSVQEWTATINAVAAEASR